MILQCFDYLTDNLKNNLRALNVSLQDKDFAENYLPTKVKSELILYYGGENDFEYDESATAYNSEVKGGLIFFNENLNDERSNREFIQKLESIKEQVIGLAPNDNAEQVRITSIEPMEKVNNFTRTRINFTFKLQNV